jgi:anti-sigma regulatory factor (Ser/Thr protein kinase)
MNAQVELQSIRIPPATVHVASVRAFVGAVARQVGYSEEVIEDLRLVASEAAAQALEEGVADDGIELRAWLAGPRLTVEIEPSGAFAPATGGGHPAQTTERRALIEALFPDAEFETRDDRSLLRLSVPDGR